MLSSKIPENGFIINTFQDAKVYKKQPESCCELHFNHKYSNYQCNNSFINESYCFNKYESKYNTKYKNFLLLLEYYLLLTTSINNLFKIDLQTTL